MEIKDFLEIWKNHIAAYRLLKLQEYEAKPCGTTRMEITKTSIMLELIAEMDRWNQRESR